MSKRRESSPPPPPLSTEMVFALEMAEIVAHEINNLLNNILLNVAVLDRKGLDAAQAELKAIRQAGTRAGAIVNRWQQLNPRRATALEATDLNGVVSKAVASWQAPAPEVRARFQPAPDLPAVLANPEEVRRLVALLLNHAAAAGPGTIQVRTEAGEGEVLLLVEDDGPGIEPALLDRVFEPFFAARALPEVAGLDAQQDLGLALGKKLARRQQGTIHAENRPEGGVRVVIHFRPARPGEGPAR